MTKLVFALDLEREMQLNTSDKSWVEPKPKPEIRARAWAFFYIKGQHFGPTLGRFSGFLRAGDILKPETNSPSPT